MSEQPVAYHITFGTYGMRLHGDERGTVDRRHNQFGEPLLEPNERWVEEDRGKLKFSPVVLSHEQRSFIEEHVPAVCDRGKWRHRISAAATNHVHVMLSAQQFKGKVVRTLLKRWIGQALSDRWPLDPVQRWWADGGSVRWAWDESYYYAIFHYILRQRATPWGGPIA